MTDFILSVIIILFVFATVNGFQRKVTNEDNENILGKQGMAVLTHAKFISPAAAGTHKSLVWDKIP